VKNLYCICFEKFGSLEYNIWTIVLFACLWLVQGVDTAQAHIYHISNLPNPFKIKFLENLLAGFRESRVSGVGAGHSGYPGYSRPGPETPGFKGIKAFDRGENPCFTSTQFFNRAPSLPSPLPIPLGDFQFQPHKSRESEVLKTPTRGDQGSTQVSKDSSLLSSLPKVHSKEFFPIYFPSVVLVVSS
jgi:hypothetical protein